MFQTVWMGCNIGLALLVLAWFRPTGAAQSQDKAAAPEAQIAHKRAAVKATESQVQIARAKLEVTKARIAAAQASENASKSRLQRLKKLFESRAVDASVVDEAEAGHQKAVAHVREAQAQIAVGEAELAREAALRDQAIADLAVTETRLKQAPAIAGEKSAEIKALLKERRDALHKAVDLWNVRLQNNAGEFAGFPQAERDALQSTLDLFDTPAQRIADLEKLEKTAAAVAKRAENLAKSGQGRESDELQARAVLLEIRIALFREKAKLKAGK